MKKKIFSLLLLSVLGNNAFSQCAVGESEVTIDVTTDQWGYEGYWELVPAGDPCGGAGTIFAGGNPTVGCNGGGLTIVAPGSGGYADNVTVTEGPWCFLQGTNLDILFVDDYADGGLTFTVNIDGLPVYGTQIGIGAGTTIPFTVTPAFNYDMELHHLSTFNYNNSGNVEIHGHLFNWSANAITSLDLNYQIGTDAIVTDNLIGLNITSFTEYDFSHSTLWNAAINGSYSVKVWASNLNGNTDENTVNDTLTRTIIIGDGIPNIIDDYIGIIAPQHAVILNSTDGVSVPRDLDFHPTLTNNELWVVLKGTEDSGSSTIKVSDAGQPGQTSLLQTDQNAYHFMSLATGLAFSENENFSTSPGVYDANHDGGSPFTGPTLWSSDPLIYAQPSGGNGSHLDMLHESPHSMGIAHESGNAFWVNDGDHNSIVRYDFSEDHGPGMHDHSDGIVRRYTGLGIVEDPIQHVVSHLVLDKPSGMLYIVDSENARVLKMDINTGSQTGTFTPIEGGIAEASVYTGTTNSVFIGTGLTRPSGIDIIEDRLIVSDYATGEIIIYDCSGAAAVELARLQTGSAGVMGVKVGPDGKIWYVNAESNEVVRLDFVEVAGIQGNELIEVNIYPNPTTDFINVSFVGDNFSNGKITVKNVSGQEVYSQSVTSQKEKIDMRSFSKGIYIVTVEGQKSTLTKKIVMN